MKKRTVVRGLLLPLVVGVASLWLLLDGVFLPNRLMPRFGLMAVVALSLLAQAIGVLVDWEGPRNYLYAALVGGATFGLIPWCAGVGELAPWVMALLGAAIFPLAELLTGLYCDRFGSEKGSRRAVFLTVLLVYLAAQGFHGFL